MARQPNDPTAFLPLSPAEFQILLTLEEGQSHGYAIMQRVEQRAGEGTILGPGTLYGALKRLRRSGLVEEVGSRRGPGAPRLVYRITRLGRRVGRAEAERHRALVRWADAAGL